MGVPVRYSPVLEQVAPDEAGTREALVATTRVDQRRVSTLIFALTYGTFIFSPGFGTYAD